MDDNQEYGIHLLGEALALLGDTMALEGPKGGRNDVPGVRSSALYMGMGMGIG
jgi:hypothetical protein